MENFVNTYLLLTKKHGDFLSFNLTKINSPKESIIPRVVNHMLEIEVSLIPKTIDIGLNLITNSDLNMSKIGIIDQKSRKVLYKGHAFQSSELKAGIGFLNYGKIGFVITTSNDLHEIFILNDCITPIHFMSMLLNGKLNKETNCLRS